MSTVRWLHISDFHLNKQGVDSQRMRNRLPEYLQKLGLKCDYIFFTGDLRYAPECKFAPQTDLYLKKICESVGNTVDRLFIVPGNHDIDRDISLRNEAIDNVLSYYNPKEGLLQKKDLFNIGLGRNDFVTVMEHVYGANSDRVKLYKDYEKPSFLIETEDFNIIHADSTILYKKGHEKFEMILGTGLLIEIFEKINPGKPSILLTHYSYDAIARNEQKQIFQILKDYHVQLWLAGHEHDKNIHEHNRYLYEFQCGNLLHEDEDTMSCFIIGEYDNVRNAGNIQVHAWFSPDGWGMYPSLSEENDRSRYSFFLQTPDAVVEQIISSSEKTILRQLGNGVVVFNAKELDQKQLKYLQNEGYIDVRAQLGAKLTGKESNDEAEQLFLNVLHMEANSNQRYETLPLLRNMIRENYTAFVYLDNDIAPFDKAKVLQFFFGPEDRYIIHGSGYVLGVTTYEQNVSYVDISYNLNAVSDVDERLLYFKKIIRLHEEHQIYIKMVNHSENNLKFCLKWTEKEIQEKINKTKCWYEILLKLSKIEEYYGIKFQLPKTVTANEFTAIDILSDSIDHKSVRHLPIVSMKGPGAYKKFKLKEEIWYNDGYELANLDLFGYCFQPCAQYILQGEFLWNKYKSGWQSTKDGIAVRVEFKIKDQADKNRDLELRIPYKEIAKDLEGKKIILITGENMAIFSDYIQFNHNVQKVGQLYDIYQEKVSRYVKYDLTKNQYMIKKKTDKVIDKLAVNELIISLISAAVKLINFVDEFLVHQKMEDNIRAYSSIFAEEYIVLPFMITIKKIGEVVHLPINSTLDGKCYIDLDTIKHIKNEKISDNLLHIIELCTEVFETYGMDIHKIDLYNMMRNFLYAFSEYYISYYRKIEHDVLEKTEKIKSIIQKYPELIVQKGRFKGYVVWQLKNEELLYAFNYEEDLYSNFLYRKQEAEKMLQRCKEGMKDE